MRRFALCRFGLRRLFHATTGIAVILWIVTSFEVDWKLIDPRTVVYTPLAADWPFGATVRAVLLGVAIGIASLVVIAGLLLRNRNRD